MTNVCRSQTVNPKTVNSNAVDPKVDSSNDQASQKPNQQPSQQTLQTPLYQLVRDEGEHLVQLNCPVTMPNASSYLWNSKMMLQMNCRGFATAQFMQPEPAKYCHAPNMEAKTFMQPEQQYFAHHPGRFFYIKDLDTNALFSVPHEPCRAPADSFKFIAGNDEISWHIVNNNLAVTLRLNLLADSVVERWSMTVKNLSTQARNIAIYPYFPIGYMSWMNQGASFDSALNAIVATSITPYQKVAQYEKNKALKDMTFLLADRVPDSWSACQHSFEGEGGLTSPDAIFANDLNNCGAYFETPTAVMQYQLCLAAAAESSYQFLFGAALNKDEIAEYKQLGFGLDDGSNLPVDQESNKARFSVDSGIDAFDAIVNQWLPRQISYHQELNRLTTDPQTRNYLQDSLGMALIDPDSTRQAILTTLGQQHCDGALPDGILLHQDAELKYINQIPHSDHSIWLPLVLLSYLNETNDRAILQALVGFSDGDKVCTVAQHLELALKKLISDTDERGLSFIEQGDWCDPMNMVGHKGKGVSAWLTMATVYAINSWTEICHCYLPAEQQSKLYYYRKTAKQFNDAINKYFWDENWYARGITDDGNLFGIASDEEGQIYLNAQSWAILCGAADKHQTKTLISQIEEKLMTPYGVMMLAPSYTKMREDIGRLTQKYPGVSENGSVYNHAAAFYIYSLYQVGEKQKAFDLMIAMMPNIETALATGQLPVFIPNYYRGAYHQFPDHAGRSSQLIHTGTIAWVYRCIVEQLCGLKGSNGELLISPQLPKEINKITGQRQFLGATFNFVVEKSERARMSVKLNNQELSGNIVNNILHGEQYDLHILVPDE